ncbi:MAG: response regulator transcription factor [Candidatus Aminicenantes bacterium]|nr:response regulator transcription factor [Candidatus Aminicenantes bacterium]
MTMKIRCMIVDDEPLAQKVLEKYIASLPSLELTHICRNALEATSYLHEQVVNLIFLDIKMPGLSGMEFLKTLTNPPLVIITTAYSEYALEGYEYAVVDYLLKPIAFERFLKAVNRVQERIKRKDIDIKEKDKPKKDQDDVFTLKCGSDLHRIRLSDIKYIEGYGNFVKIHTLKKTILATAKMKVLEKELTKSHFVRVHKSYIVSLGKIERIKDDLIHIMDDTIPIGRFYKKGLEKIIPLYK